jgi:hypothetical protein
MLSAAACPAMGMNSFSVQLPAWGSIDSFIIFEFVYIKHTASIAPGARAIACAWVTAPPAAFRHAAPRNRAKDGASESRQGASHCAFFAAPDARAQPRNDCAAPDRYTGVSGVARLHSAGADLIEIDDLDPLLFSKAV